MECFPFLVLYMFTSNSPDVVPFAVAIYLHSSTKVFADPYNLYA